jgi:hypothetical protein
MIRIKDEDTEFFLDPAMLSTFIQALQEYQTHIEKGDRKWLKQN